MARGRYKKNNQKRSNSNEYQIRKTFVDTINSQIKLMRFIRGKINGKPHMVSWKESEEFFILVAKSFLSQGTNSHEKCIIKPIMMVKDEDGKKVKIRLARNVHRFGLSLIDYGDESEYKTLTYKSKEYIISKRELWKTFLEYAKDVFTYAIGEALHISREDTIVEEKSLGWSFNSDQKIE